MTSDNKDAATFCSVGSETTALTDEEIKSLLHSFLKSMGPREDVLILPPDYTRVYSQAGKVTQFVAEYYNFIGSEKEESEADGNKRQKMESPPPKAGATAKNSNSSSSPEIKIMPALGTHVPMTPKEIESMFGEELAAKVPNPFLVHDWRNDVVTIGHAPAEMVTAATRGYLKDKEWPAQLNKLVWDKRQHDVEKQPHKTLILSIGQVIPHEVMGMANFNKNIFVGTGGVNGINLSHFIGAVHGMENLMGHGDNPLRSILNYATTEFLEKELDLWYILTVVGKNAETGKPEIRGFYIGKNVECYQHACDLSLKVNLTLMEKPLSKVVVYLDENKFHTTWLGNKSIYRTRMAIADGGELIIIAPGIKGFGEDDGVDNLIRKYGYVGTPIIMEAMETNDDLKENLSAVAHIIHGSSEGRFNITYCPGHLTREEIESAGYKYGDIEEVKKLYNIGSLKDGWNKREVTDGKTEEFFYVSDPSIGLWATKSRFESSGSTATKDNENVKSVEVSATQVAQGGSGGVGGWEKPPAP